jgi:Protein of unknown function (DUF4232)
MVRSVWHRTLLLMLAACALAVVATFHLSPGAPEARAGAPVPATSSTDAVRSVGAAAPECRSADLRADYRARDAAAGHRYGVIRLRNTSDRACVVQGYGGLSYVGGGDGTAIGAPADREPGATPRVVLAPGERALSRVSETVAQNYPRRTCRPADVDAFLVYPPDATRPFFVMHRTTGCLDESVHLLSHRPFHG